MKATNISNDRSEPTPQKQLQSRLIGIGILVGMSAFFVIGLVQLAAVYSFLCEIWGLWGPIAAVVSMFVAYMPLVGTLMGGYAAHAAWGMSWLSTFILFFGSTIIYMTGCALFVIFRKK